MGGGCGQSTTPAPHHLALLPFLFHLWLVLGVLALFMRTAHGLARLIAAALPAR
jgi:hypothetical protein